MIYDVFLFHDEIEILRIRLNELGDHVDAHVVLQSNIDMRGNPRDDKWKEIQLVSLEAKRRATLIPLIHKEQPFVGSHQVSEALQSRMRGSLDVFARSISPSDTIIFSDADEIPRASTVVDVNRIGESRRLEMANHIYALNFRKITPGKWTPNTTRPIAGPAADFAKHGFNAMRWTVDAPVITNAGWHFSYLGGYDRLLTKIRSHGEGYNSDWLFTANRSEVQQRIDSGTVFDGVESYDVVPIDDSYPSFVIENEPRYRQIGLIREVLDKNHKSM